MSTVTPLHPCPGVYRHYKGKDYEVLGVVRHSETEEELVLYRALYGEYGLWVRPLGMFVETVSTDVGEVPRFCLVEAREASLKTILKQ
ncbi:MAG: DUF1653 domain-containing protein [Oleiphilaceae bacterium]|nr:DUF1653 domain-containing protein [Oleiphilaceae bacterium]